MKKKYLSIPITVFFVIVTFGLAHATTINYTAQNLTDLNQGEDLWQYSYNVSDNVFAADTGFTIYFDLGLYDLLDPFPVSPNSDWDVVTWDPDPFLPDDGAYDAYALADNASLADTFTVDFVWLGGGNTAPGSQFFEVYNGLTWSVLEEGNTSAAPAPVPEPATMLLFASGLAGFAGFSNMRKKIKK